MGPTIPVLGRFRINQAQVRFVDQGRGFQGLSRLLMRHLLGGQLSQLIVDKRQKQLGGMRVASVNGREKAGNFAHRRHREDPESLRKVLMPILDGGTESLTSVGVEPVEPTHSSPLAGTGHEYTACLATKPRFLGHIA
jgi:hypothetical protein